MACATRRSRTTGHPLCGSAVRAEGHRPVDRRLPHVETSCRAGGGRTLRAVRPDADRRAGGPGAGSRRHLSAATGRRRYAGDLQCLRHLRHAHAGTGNVRHGGGGGAGLRQAGCCQRSWRPARDRSGIRWSAFPNRRLCGLGRPPGSAPGQPRFAGHAGSGRARKCRAVRLASYRPTLPGGLRRTMSTPLVSIAMPFYNAECTIGASIRSMLLQTYPNWELLLCDDGSTDASRELARAFHDPRIVVCGDQRRLQLGARLNECIERARGEYVARMDADDIAYPRRLEKQLRFLADHPEVDLTGGWAVLFADAGAPVGKRADPAAHGQIARWPLYSFKLIHPTFMGKTSWFRRYRYRADAIRCEDHDLLFRACADRVRPELLDDLGVIVAAFVRSRVRHESPPRRVTGCRIRRGGGSTVGTHRPRRGLSVPGRGSCSSPSGIRPRGPRPNRSGRQPRRPERRR